MVSNGIRKVTWVKWLLGFFVMIFFITSLTACHLIRPTRQTSTTQGIATLNGSIRINEELEDHYRSQHFSSMSAGVNSALLPPLSHYFDTEKRSKEVRFDVNANNIPVKDFYMGLVAGTHYNMVVSPKITGTVSLTLKNVTVREALDAMQDIYGYEYHSTPYGFEIVLPAMETQVFHINYPNVERIGRSYTQLTTGQISNKIGTTSTGSSNNNNNNSFSQPLMSNNNAQDNVLGGGSGTISSLVTKSTEDFWKHVEDAIKSLIPMSDGRTVTMSAEAGIVVVHAYPSELRRVARYINNVQRSLQRQVALEAKIIEVNLNDEYQAGIDWSILANPAYDQLNGTGSTLAGIGQAANSAFPSTDFQQLNGIFAFRVNGDFKLLINLLQTQGNVQVLSSPQISTVNNQKAVIKVGQDEFFVTGVSTTNSVVGTNTLPSQDVSLTPFFSGITLDVTPEISGNDEVILHIHPSVSRVTQQTKEIGLGSTSSGAANTLSLPLALSTIRESDNVVKAKNGQVIVIGGLMENHTVEQIVETPWISHIPFFGSLFRRTQQTSLKSELVILLRPIITNNCAEIAALESNKRSLEILNRPFHQGGMTKIFGNEGEVAPDQ